MHRVTVNIYCSCTLVDHYTRVMQSTEETAATNSAEDVSYRDTGIDTRYTHTKTPIATDTSLN